jgi:hypothetical protein
MHATIRASLPEAKSLAHRCGLKNEAVREEESERANAKRGRAFQALPSASPRLPKGTVAKKAKGKAMAKSVGGWVMDAKQRMSIPLSVAANPTNSLERARG